MEMDLRVLVGENSNLGGRDKCLKTIEATITEAGKVESILGIL